MPQGACLTVQRPFIFKEGRTIPVIHLQYTFRAHCAPALQLGKRSFEKKSQADPLFACCFRNLNSRPRVNSRAPRLTRYHHTTQVPLMNITQQPRPARHAKHDTQTRYYFQMAPRALLCDTQCRPALNNAARGANSTTQPERCKTPPYY
jgi:hypothetical protein